MTSVAASRTTNRRALLLFMTVLVLAVGLAGAAAVWLQGQHLRANARQEVQLELELLAELGMESLLRSDYAGTERLVKTWVERHDYLFRLTAVMPNGFVLADAHKAHEARDPFPVEHVLRHDGRTVVTLRAVADVSAREREFTAIVGNAAVAAGVMIALLGWALWATLQRTAIRPLEDQIRSREEKERELLQRTNELEAALRELESFSYSVSHDLRTPLRAIDGFTHALSEDYGPVLDATAHDYLARTRAAAQGMGALIDDLLALARMSRRELAVQDVDLSALARGILERLAQSDPGRRVTVAVSPDLRARGDRGLLAVALENLLHNAWKYTRHTASAFIEFTAGMEGGERVYTVRDNGAGFDMQYAEKLFHPFQRLHRAEDFEGTGVGLALVSRVVGRHGGRVWAQAEPGKGAAFHFTLRAG